MKKIVILTVAALVVLGGLFLLRPDSGKPDNTLTVMFPSTTSLYEGAQVKVLGVKIGTVESIEVEGAAVRVEMTYDPTVKLPADVHAVIVPPSVVGDRFVQLAPAYTGGEVLASGAELGLDRSSVPLELDDTYRALEQVTGDLGPNGANKDGALSEMISGSADNIRGRGELLNSTIRELADAIAVLAGSSDDFQGTTTNLARLNTQLAGSDDVIRSLAKNLVLVATELNSQGDDLTLAVTSLERALGRVGTFAKDNREALKGTIDGLTSVSSNLRKHTRELEELSDLAPVGLVNLLRTYVPRNWDPTNPGNTTVNGRTGSQNLHNAALEDLSVQLGYTFSALCEALPPAQAEQLSPFCTALGEAGGDLTEVILGANGGQAGATAPSAREARQRQPEGGRR